MLRPSLCDYGDAYVFVRGAITVTNTAAQDAANNAVNKNVIFKSCAPNINCINRIKNTQVDYAHDIDVVMEMCNLIEYSDTYSKTIGVLWQYCRDEPVLAANDDIVDLNEANATTKLFNLKAKIMGQTGSNNIQNFKIMVSLKYLVFGELLKNF